MMNNAATNIVMIKEVKVASSSGEPVLLVAQPATKVLETIASGVDQ